MFHGAELEQDYGEIAHVDAGRADCSVKTANLSSRRRTAASACAAGASIFNHNNR